RWHTRTISIRRSTRWTTRAATSSSSRPFRTMQSGGPSPTGCAELGRTDMRSRPKVKVLLSPGVAQPAGRLVTETILDARSETPVDFVSTRLEGRFAVSVGAGNARAFHQSRFFAKEWRSKPE